MKAYIEIDKNIIKGQLAFARGKLIFRNTDCEKILERNNVVVNYLSGSLIKFIDIDSQEKEELIFILVENQ